MNIDQRAFYYEGKEILKIWSVSRMCLINVGIDIQVSAYFIVLVLILQLFLDQRQDYPRKYTYARISYPFIDAIIKKYIYIYGEFQRGTKEYGIVEFVYFQTWNPLIVRISITRCVISQASRANTYFSCNEQLTQLEIKEAKQTLSLVERTYVIQQIDSYD